MFVIIMFVDWTGTDPIDVEDKDGTPGKMYMRGRNIFDAIISDLKKSYGFKDASEVILSGGSAVKII